MFLQIPTLKEMFQPGDILPVKILSVSEEYSSLMLTFNPKAINSKHSYNTLETGLILVGSVKSREEHGFIVDLGIDQTHCFLPFDKVSNY